MVIIGSHALNYYGRLRNRKPNDWDIISNGSPYSVSLNGIKLDVISTDNKIEPTNLEIYEYCIQNSIEKATTPIGEASVAPLEILKVLKLASTSMDKEKHFWDLKEMEDVELNEYLIDLASRRKEETDRRVRDQKNKFFNKYKIPRFYDHDQLHLFISEYPAYLKIIDSINPTEVDELKFNRLSLIEKKLIIWEESMVLSIERDLVPKVLNAPMFVEAIASEFYETERSSSSSLKWMSRLSIPGKIKDHPEWLAKWARCNSNHLFDGYSQWWGRSFEDLPVSFWEDLIYGKEK